MSVPTRKGKYMLRTACGHCKAVFSSIDRANNHLQKQHREKRFLAPVGDPLIKVKWSRKGIIEQEIMLGMEMGESWGSRVPPKDSQERFEAAKTYLEALHTVNSTAELK